MGSPRQDHPYSIPTTHANAMDGATPAGTKPLSHKDFVDYLTPGGRGQRNFDIFEGTEQIQQLVIARAISGLRIQ